MSRQYLAALTVLMSLAALTPGCGHSEAPAAPPAGAQTSTNLTPEGQQRKMAAAQGLRNAARLRGQAMQRAEQH